MVEREDEGAPEGEEDDARTARMEGKRTEGYVARNSRVFLQNSQCII
jgi:hypothetical protein